MRWMLHKRVDDLERRVCNLEKWQSSTDRKLDEVLSKLDSLFCEVNEKLDEIASVISKEEGAA